MQATQSALFDRHRNKAPRFTCAAMQHANGHGVTLRAYDSPDTSASTSTEGTVDAASVGVVTRTFADELLSTDSETRISCDGGATILRGTNC